ncbi:MAG: hypothetical protein ISS23_00565 [Nanoarchaeota archaeon]|nr:hypothetical protein [Nanoarchaeota archaeon]
MLFIETLFFRTAIFIHDYLNASLIIANALAGLGLGAVIAGFFRKLKKSMLNIVLILSVIFSFFNFVYFPEYLFFSPVMMSPFIIGAIIISYYLREENSHKVYFFNLLGATSGIFSSLILIPFFREENCFIFIIALLALISLFNKVKYDLLKIMFLIFFVLASCFLVYNLFYDEINFVKMIDCSDVSSKTLSIFCEEPSNLISSHGSNIQRIDIINHTIGFIQVYYDGFANDHIISAPYETYKFDARIVDGLIEKPKFLIIGTSAEGILKPAKAQGGKITGLEINKAVIDLMQGPMSSISKDAYRHIDKLVNVDARTFLYSDDSLYDIITLINSHMTTGGHFDFAENLHSYEAFNSYFEHLTDRGFIILEERNINTQGKLSVLSILATCVQVMRDRGIKDPENHIFLYYWDYSFEKFVGIVIKNKPFSEKDWEIIHRWKENLKENKGTSIIEIYPNDSSTQLEKHMAGLQSFINPNITIITDNKPYPLVSDSNRKFLENLVIKSGLVCLNILFFIFIFLKIRNKKIFNPYFLLSSLYFSLIGLGYLTIEIGLINFYQIFTGSPSNAFIFILGTLLISSGIGSFVSKKYSKGKVLVAIFGIIILSLYHLFINKGVIIRFSAGPLFNSILVGLTVFPLGYCMGVPFPWMLEVIKKRLNKSYVMILFAINTVFSAFAVILSLYLSILYGFKVGFTFGIICYSLVIFLIFLNKK